MSDDARGSDLFSQDREGLLSQWVTAQSESASIRSNMISKEAITDQAGPFLKSLEKAFDSGESDIMGPGWSDVRGLLTEISRERAVQGFTPTETATFLMSLKRPLFERIRKGMEKDPAAAMQQTWQVNEMLDRLALFTTEIHQKSREEMIQRQQDELLELSTPVIKIWDDVLAIPLIGTLDSQRTQIVMESLLQQIVTTGASVAIIDITGVPTVDTLVAQHLLKTVAAARLMGAECIVSGIRPQIAQTIVHLGIDLEGTMTRASLADAIKLALKETGWEFARHKRQR